MCQEIQFLDRRVTISTSPHTKTLLPRSWTPAPWSVICGRGQETFKSCGNRRLRVLVEANLSRYSHSSKVTKSVIIADLVNTIKEAAGMGGFVRFDQKSKRYIELDDASARERVGQSLREALLRTNPTKLNARKEKRRAKAARKRMTSGSSSVSACSTSSSKTATTSCSSSCDGSVTDSISIAPLPPKQIRDSDSLVAMCDSMPPLQLEALVSMGLTPAASLFAFPELSF